MQSLHSPATRLPAPPRPPSHLHACTGICHKWIFGSQWARLRSTTQFLQLFWSSL